MCSWRRGYPKNLIVFLTALAIADDLGAVLVIAVFYTASIDLHALGAAITLLIVLLLFNCVGLCIRCPTYSWAHRCGTRCFIRHPRDPRRHSSGSHDSGSAVVLPAEFERRIEELQTAFAADRRDASTPDDPLGNQVMATISEAVESISARERITCFARTCRAPTRCRRRS